MLFGDVFDCFVLEIFDFVLVIGMPEVCWVCAVAFWLWSSEEVVEFFCPVLGDSGSM